MRTIVAMAALLCANLINAQAFNGKGDTKLQIGATVQDGGTGIVATTDFGLADNLSFGFSASYMLSADDILGQEADFGDRADVKARLNANIGNIFGIGDQFDVYPGLDLGLRNFGGHLGFRYFFSDGFGLYTEGGIPIATYKSNPEGFDKYNNQFVWQIGVSFNF